MNERDIFIAALEKPTAEERSEYLGLTCAGDSTLRERVEGLLRKHEQTGEFLQKPLMERLAEGVAALEDAAETARDPSTIRKGGEGLGFLGPSEQPGSLGRLGHYEVQEVIGSGGMGIVLRAFDEQLHRMVAIKVMAAPLATNAAARKRFLREARAAAAVCHDHIVTIHAVEESGDLPYLVMQCVAGMSLQERIDRDGPLGLHEILRIGRQIAAGLAAAHAQGLIHRDIKPANILLENGVERVKITDFGLARAAADASISQSGMVAGTPQYMAPEQAKGEALDGRTDLFSLGSVLYAMCTGRAPFRAANSIAVLKRVCEEAPSPVREANADIPEWLVALIDKLQAKDPAERFQSAAEVADVLGRHLAHVQHPSVAPLPAASLLPSPLAVEGSGVRGRRRWAVAAAVVLALLIGGLSLTEATGVTQVVPTVIRIVTGEGTLVVEVDDPGIRVQIDGEDLTITGAGVHELRLRPGSYQVRATRDGNPVREELVTITRGGKQVVKVRLEADSPATAQPAAKPEPQAFVVLGGQDVPERNFGTLAEAVEGASDGDTIEIRGNGPFASQPFGNNQALTIRAGGGFRPVIRFDAEGFEGSTAFCKPYAPLVLEGLDLQLVSPEKPSPLGYVLIYVTTDAPLSIANCRFVADASSLCIWAGQPSTPVPLRIEIRNSEMFNSWSLGPIVHEGFRTERLVLENCLLRGSQPLVTVLYNSEAVAASIRLTRNTFVSAGPSLSCWALRRLDLDKGREIKPITLEASENVFDSQAGLFRFDQGEQLVANPLPLPEAKALLQQLLGWRERGNLYPVANSLLTWTVEPPPELAEVTTLGELKTLEEWNGFWGQTETSSQVGQPLYKGAHGKPLDQLTPEDFRLRSDSPGYHAGEDGRDLGADIDLVGPGPAYERWKKTPEYQQWLADTGQVKVAVPQAERGAFVLLGGEGVAERKFDTLAEAVLAASDGDTIEVRGNGPFVSEPVTILGSALTIRGGEGFRPVIQLSPEGVQRKQCLLTASAALVLEGLDLRDADNWVLYTQAPLWAANCRFRDPNINSSVCVFRNCESRHVSGWPRPGGRWTFENCLLRAKGIVLMPHYYDGSLLDVGIQIKRSTVVGSPSLYLCLDVPLPVPPDARQAAQPIRLDVSGSVFGGPYVLGFDLVPQKPLDKAAAPQPAEAEATLLRLLKWRGERNIFAAGSTSVWANQLGQHLPPGPKGLEAWQRFWGGAEVDSLEGRLRFQGGDLFSRIDADLDQLTPEDFRLRPDSDGYRAGKDGQDLGADVDLVGPGEAYERWKQTPEYQEWLKETGQAKVDVPQAERKAFVLLGGEGVAERKFDTLPEAVQGASDGDTIEIRGNGPFTSEAISISHDLTIRAGQGFRPLIRFERRAPGMPGDYLLASSAHLTLEGLEVRVRSRADYGFVRAGPALDVANCRFYVPGLQYSIVSAPETRRCSLRNCEFVAYVALNGAHAPGGEWIIENCVYADGAIATYDSRYGGPNGAVRISHVSVVQQPRRGAIGLIPGSLEQVDKKVQFQVSDSVFCPDALLSVCRSASLDENGKPFTPDGFAGLLPKLMTFAGTRNVYSSYDPNRADVQYLVSWDDFWRHELKGLAAWRDLWGSPETDCIEGRVQFANGDLGAKIVRDLDQVTPDDYRLAEGSPGYRAGPDGKDLGADVDLVGPGPAYERWKQTPDYQQWLKDTGESK